VTSLLKQISSVSPEERPAFGSEVNQLKHAIEALLVEKKGSAS